MAYEAFTSAEIDADSPLNEPFFLKMANNFEALEGVIVTNGDAHDHEGGDGAVIPQGGLKTAIGSVSATLTRQHLTLPGGDYGFYPQIKMDSANNAAWDAVISGDDGAAFIGWSSYKTNISLYTGSAVRTIYAQQRYISASPPYKIGDKKWGHFLYLLQNISTKEVIASYEAEDPPYAYNGPSNNPKDSIERIQAVPHPFVEYWHKDPALDGLEIVLVDLREYNTKKWKEDNAKQGKGLLEDLGHINKGGQIVTPQELGIGNIQGFTDKVKIRKA
ncbi:hypothetical protein KAR91_42915 [Candidatus Pacearchaeota archaeon]|nr:hypothetical protein [Candidatus Pacearchaeota archaeon]